MVVQDALDTILYSGLYSMWLTPITYVGMTLSFVGAVMTTFFAPASRWALDFSTVLNAPVDSMMYSAPHAFQGI